MPKASDDYHPMACMMEQGAPFLAKVVAPPARMGWLLMVLSKNKCSQSMKRERVGIEP